MEYSKYVGHALNGKASPMTRADGCVPSPYAFFDLDETVVACKTMFSFQDFWFRNRSPWFGRMRAERFQARFNRYRWSGEPREFINRAYYASFAGRNPADVAVTARDWFAELRRTMKPFYVPAAVEAIRAHQCNGTKIVFVSGSLVSVIQPIADELEVDHILGTRLEVVRGRYTGEIIPPQTIGEGKAIAVRRFLQENQCDGSDCWAYGDHISDIPMLSSVGRPVIVSSEPAMIRLAEASRWSRIDPGIDIKYGF